MRVDLVDVETSERAGRERGSALPAPDRIARRTQAATAATGAQCPLLTTVTRVLRVLLLGGAIGICATPAAGALLTSPPITTRPVGGSHELVPAEAPADVPEAADPVVRWEAANPVPIDTRTTQEVFASYVTQVGGYDVTVEMDWLDACDAPDKGAEWIQGCVAMDGSAVVHMKDVPRDLATSGAGKYAALHEYAHILQDRLGTDRVAAAGTAVFGAGNEVEMSADCMAVLLGTDPSTYTPAYTGDCTGERGAFAAALIAGRMP